jgi:hypothetical protein
VETVFQATAEPSVVLTAPAGGVLAAAEPAPAGGAALDQILVAGGFTLLVYGALAWVMWRERRGGSGGSPGPVGRLAERLGRLDGGSPRWFLAPLLVQVVGALSAAVGLYWDVSFHISEGRDEGPLANPAHYFIFFGLIAMFLGGALALALADDRLPARTMALTRSWRVPIGPALSTGIALCALAGFPLDDVWHRLFGQDVTEWGPTHIVMIGGTILLPYSMLLTCAETRAIGSPSRVRTLLEYLALVIVFVGPVAFLLEYAYGVPQFPLLMDPIVLSIAVGVTMTLAMLRGRGWVVATWLGYAVLQGLLMALNVWVFDALVPWPPLLVGGVAAALLLARFARPTYAFGALGGGAVAAVTVGTEFFWAQVVRPMPWPADALPHALAWALLTGAVAGMVTVWLHARLGEVALEAPATRPARRSALVHVPALAAAVALVGVVAFNAPPRDDVQVSARLSYDPVARADGARAAFVQARVEPGTSPARAWWFEAMAWQGGGLVRADMREVSPGVYRSARPLPLHGAWKTLLRLHMPTHALVSAPLYLPADPAIPAPEVPAVQGAQREFVVEKHILRREEKKDVPTWLWAAGYAITFALFGLVFALIAAAYTLAARPRREPVPSARTPAPVGAGT